MSGAGRTAGTSRASSVRTSSRGRRRAGRTAVAASVLRRTEPRTDGRFMSLSRGGRDRPAAVGRGPEGSQGRTVTGVKHTHQSGPAPRGGTRAARDGGRLPTGGSRPPLSGCLISGGFRPAGAGRGR